MGGMGEDVSLGINEDEMGCMRLVRWVGSGGVGLVGWMVQVGSEVSVAVRIAARYFTHQRWVGIAVAPPRVGIATLTRPAAPPSHIQRKRVPLPRFETYSDNSSTPPLLVMMVMLVMVVVASEWRVRWLAV